MSVLLKYFPDSFQCVCNVLLHSVQMLLEMWGVLRSKVPIGYKVTNLEAVMNGFYEVLTWHSKHMDMLKLIHDLIRDCGEPNVPSTGMNIFALVLHFALFYSDREFLDPLEQQSRSAYCRNTCILQSLFGSHLVLPPRHCNRNANANNRENCLRPGSLNFGFKCAPSNQLAIHIAPLVVRAAA